MAVLYGAYFENQEAGSNIPHILSYATTRSVADDAVFEVWKGQTNATRVFRLTQEGQVQGQDGTAAKPTWSYENDKDTGWYRIGADNIGLSIGGTKKWDVAAGNVTLSQDLLFTDDTYDIGKSGATRPRFLYLSQDATIGGYIKVTEYVQPTTAHAGVTGSMCYSSTGGLQLWGRTGSAYDFVLLEAAGAIAMAMFTGTAQMVVYDNFFVRAGSEGGDITLWIEADQADDTVDRWYFTAYAAGGLDIGQQGVGDYIQMNGGVTTITSISVSTGSINGDVIVADTMNSGTWGFTQPSTTIIVGDDNPLQFGTGADYWFVYNSTGTQFELWTTDADGIGTNGLIFSVDDGTDDVDFTGGATFGGALAIAGTAYIGDTANANVTLGLTINQGGADNLALALKSTDVAHALTTGTASQNAETDDYYTVAKVSPTVGGALISVLAKNSATSTVLRHEVYGNSTPNTTKSTAGRANIEFALYQHDGANNLANMAAGANLVAIRARVGGSEVSRWIVDEDGDTWQAGGATFTGAVSGITTLGSSGAATLDSGGTGSSFGGALAISGALTGVTRATVTTGASLTAGSLWGSAANGLVLTGLTGSSLDLLVTTPGGGSIFDVGTGTDDVRFYGAVGIGAAPGSTSGNLTIAGALAGVTTLGSSGAATLDSGGTGSSFGGALTVTGDLVADQVAFGGVAIGADRALHVARSGAVTASDYAAVIYSNATSSTAGISKVSLYLDNTGTNNGAGSKSVGLLISTVSGGTSNYGIYETSSSSNYFASGTAFGSGVYIGGLASASYDLEINSSTDALDTMLSARNTSTGTSAAVRFQLGTNVSPSLFTVDVSGGNHASTPNKVIVLNQTSTGLTEMGGGGGTCYTLYDPSGATDTIYFFGDSAQIGYVKQDGTSGIGSFLVQGGDSGTSYGAYLTVSRNTNGSTPASGFIQFINLSGSAYHIWPDTSGDLRIYTGAPTNANDTAGTVVGTQTSDYRIKRDIEVWDGSGAVDAIMGLRLWSYRFEDDPKRAGKTMRGLVIHDEDRGSWWTMNDHRDGNMAALDEANLFGAFVAGFQNHESRVAELEKWRDPTEARIAALESENETLKDRIRYLEAA